MTSPQQRSASWLPLVGAMALGAMLAGVIAWRLNLRHIERQITARQSALKKLTVSGGIPPTEAVMEYLTSRQTSLEHRYQQWLKTVTVGPVADASAADPQLYFQEQVHEVQRTLERLATARGMPVPEQLGFPKELPPSDTVGRLLVQLSLMREAAALILEQGVLGLASLKVEDPETIAAEQGEGMFLMRLPVRLRVSATLPQLLKILSAIERVKPLIDVRALRIVPAATAASLAPAETERLDAELLLARYVAMEAPAPAAPREKRKAGSTATKASHD